MESKPYKPTHADLVQMDRLRLIYALLDAAPDMPREVRWDLADYADRLLREERDERREPELPLLMLAA